MRDPVIGPDFVSNGSNLINHSHAVYYQKIAAHHYAVHDPVEGNAGSGCHAGHIDHPRGPLVEGRRPAGESESDTVYSTGYSFQLLVRNDELTWEPLMADIYVPAIGKDLQPGEEMTYELDAQIFESGKTYKAVWRYEPVDDPKHPLYSETEAIMAP